MRIRVHVSLLRAIVQRHVDLIERKLEQTKKSISWVPLGLSRLKRENNPYLKLVLTGNLFILLLN